MNKKMLMIITAVLTVAAFAQEKPVVQPKPSLQAMTGSQTKTGSQANPADEKTAMKEPPAFNWDQTSVDMVLQAYGDQIGKTVLKDPGTPNANITLKSREGQKLTQEEYLEAIEVVLEMNGVHLEPYGEKFIRAVPRAKARKVVGMAVYMSMEDARKSNPKDGTVISVRLKFDNIGTEEAQKALEGFKSDSGLLQVFERTNSILVTDTWENIKRMDEIIRSIDKGIDVKEKVFYKQIRYANVNDIKAVLEAIVQESQKELEKNKVANNGRNQSQTSSRFTPAGTVGNRFAPFARNQPQQPQPSVNESQVTSLSDAERGMIRGKVLIIADERSNKLIIVTEAENMKSFDTVIEELDIETTPDTVVKVYRLKYADAEEVSDMINDLIGNAASSKSSSKGSQNATSKNAASKSTAKKTTTNQRTGDAKAGELSKDNTTVLADKRINGLVVMTEKDLVKTIETIIESMDVKLSQVLIETVIVEVGLDNSIKTGVDWISGLKSGGTQALAGGMDSSDENLLKDGEVLATKAVSLVPSGQGLGYFAYLKDLDLSMIVRAAKSDTHSKYLASPVVMTVDNKEATIDATTKQQFITGWQAVSSSYAGSGLPSPTYASTDIGLKVKVTPKINPNGTVMLNVEEEYTQVAGKQDMLVPSTTTENRSTYTTQKVDIPTTRKMTSDVLLENMQTIVFGGLIESKETEVDAGIPILKDIPWIGKWLFGSVDIAEKRTELLVFMTPYVMDDGQAAQAEAARRKKSLSDPRPWDDHGWSESKLADPVSAKEQLRKQRYEWKKLDEEHAAEREIEKSKEERVQMLLERMKEEAEEDAKRKQEQGK